MVVHLLENIDAKKPDFINRKKALSIFWDDCKAEIEILRKETVNVKLLGTLSLLDLCKEKNENKLALISQNEQVKNILKTLNFKEKYPYLDEKIQAMRQESIVKAMRSRRARDRRALTGEAGNASRRKVICGRHGHELRRSECVPDAGRIAA